MATSFIQDGQKFEVVLIGDYGVGKTSLIDRISGNNFSLEISTVNFVNVEYPFRVSDTLTKKLVVKFPDTGGMENWGNLPTNYFRRKDGFILTWDISNADTYGHLDQWEETIRSHTETTNLPAVIVVANKSDKHYNPEVYTRCVEKYSKRGIECFKTSAKDGENVKEAFDKLVSLMVGTSHLRHRVPVKRIDLYPIEEPRRSCC